jgi:phosphoglycerol transferase MdoB-like AlkP superfamily enzyme
MKIAWNAFFRQAQRDLRFWLFAMGSLTVCRVVLILIFRHQIAEQEMVANLAAALLTGLRFDCVAATFWTLAPLLATLLCAFWPLEKLADRVRLATAGIFLAGAILLEIATVEFFRHFHDVLNPLIFHASSDGGGALLGTLYQEYHLVGYLLATALLWAAGMWVFRRYFTGEWVAEEIFGRYTASNVRRTVINLAILLLVVVGVRGSLGSSPVKMKHVAVGSDVFLNRTVLNPYWALASAVATHHKMYSRKGIEAFLPDGNVAAALRESFPTHPPAADLDGYLERRASGPRCTPPRHIFLLDMESYDAWPMLEKYRGLKVAECGRQLARRGLCVQAFLPAARMSIESFTGIIVGLPDSSLMLTAEASSQTAYPTSLAATLRRLGYRTRMFCGTTLSWENIGDFARRQGFDEVYGAGDIGHWTEMNDWGVADEHLFDFAAKTVGDDRPSFNLIVSTSNHPPYTVDLKAKGISCSVPPELDAEFEFNRAEMLKILGHHAYSDRCLGKFVLEEESRVTRPLFVITGDHYGHNFINSRPTLFEESAVPLILYGREVLRGVTLPEGVAGSHLDIVPTLIECAAPKGFAYHAVGRNLLEPRAAFMGYGGDRVITANYVAEVGEVVKVAAIPGRFMPATLPDLERLGRQCRNLQGIAWWRVRNGSTLPPDKSPVPLVALSPDQPALLR